MNKRKIMIVGFLSFCITIGTSGCSTATVYENENINAVVTNSDDEKELLVRINVTPSNLPETLKQRIEEELVHDFEIQLSDGTYYGYHDDTNDNNGGAFIETFSTMSDMEEILDKNLIYSTELIYPDDEVNFVLSILPTDNGVSVNSASVAFTDKISVQGTLYMSYGSSDGNFTPSLTGVTDEIYCEESETSFGEEVLVLVDETADKAGIYLEMDEIIYWWSFEGDFDKEDIMSFINTLEE